ncbi:hypothetical protein EBESD8_53700 [Rhodococcus aetherivorans]|nr:hypothetical protein EBESD8_53700 [Rhodococcus aetherivorans]
MAPAATGTPAVLRHGEKGEDEGRRCESATKTTTWAAPALRSLQS